MPILKDFLNFEPFLFKWTLFSKMGLRKYKNSSLICANPKNLSLACWNQKGISLLEILFVIGLLASIALWMAASTIFDKDQRTCEGTLTSIQHGRQTIEMTMKDACGGVSNKEQLVWDTDLPSTFKPRPLSGLNSSGERVFAISSAGKYPVQAVKPAESIAGFVPTMALISNAPTHVNSIQE